ncbi:MAG: sugar phosphate nucleotidyltransferase [Bacilli bacterium]|nr:sugar phosphate nucleotidyltransferase [Clostridium sp.]MDY2804846.1 sugar phosphate nucleotidyltransferase [Bacilli bacterium]
MKKDITLVILAAGMGSRFGGLKQIEPMGPNGEFIIDYSVYDAIKAGFNKIVFLIKRETYDLFKETIGARVEPYIKTEYAFQELNNLPLGYTLPSDRVKPLGTAHAVLCCKEKVHENFAMINSDDFYGRDAFIKAYEYLSKVDESSSEYGMVGYKVANTLTENGSVKRGVCNVDNNGYLTNLTESKVERVNNEIIASPLDGSKAFTVKDDDTVSMNFLLFTPSIFNYIEDGFPKFFDNNKDNLLTAEYLIPDVLSNLIKNNKASTKVIPTSANWYGVTYKEDTPGVKRAIQNLVNNHEYNDNLWD